MTIFYKIVAIVPFLSLSIISTAQQVDSSKTVIVADSTTIKIDTPVIKQNRFKTAAKVWETLVLSTPRDFVEMGHTLKKDWKSNLAYVAGVSLVVLADKPITKWYQDKLEKTIDYTLPALPGSKGNQFFRGNDAYLNYSIIALYGGSLATNYKTGQRAALNSLKALGYSYLLVHVGLKAAFARQRPDPTLSDGIPPRAPLTTDPHEFFHFRKLNFNTGPDGTSFPSFHATAYYAVAKVMAMEFDNYWIPYGLVTFVFFADLDAHKHWVGDMVAGGLLGTLIGKGIVTSSRYFEKKRQQNQANSLYKKKFKANYSLLPEISNRMTGLTLRVGL